MLVRRAAIATTALSLALLASALSAVAADLSSDKTDQTTATPQTKPVFGAPFFFINDNQFTFSIIPQATDPGTFSLNPNGSIRSSTTVQQLYTFSHFDAWAYGTNFVNISLIQSNQNDPATPCANAGVLLDGAPAFCSGATEVYGLFRSTLGWNEIFNTHAFSVGPLRDVSFEVGMDANTKNNFMSPAKRSWVAGVQFTFNLPYRGHFNVSPMIYDEFSNHNSYTVCGLYGPYGPNTPGVNCLTDGTIKYRATWAVEANYYMDLGFLPENLQFFNVSGYADWYGPKGNQFAPLGAAGGGTSTATELFSEPIRLTMDVGKAVRGASFAHVVELWAGYRYWQNKFGLNASNSPTCQLAPGVSNHTCTESSLWTGVDVHF
jgi:hypothetical protein